MKEGKREQQQKLCLNTVLGLASVSAHEDPESVCLDRSLSCTHHYCSET